MKVNNCELSNIIRRSYQTNLQLSRLILYRQDCHQKTNSLCYSNQYSNPKGSQVQLGPNTSLKIAKQFSAALCLLALLGCDSSEISSAKNEVKVILKDPDSAVFSNVETIEDTGAVCGEVNSKNLYGAFTGNKTFVYFDNSITMEDDNYGFSTILDKCGLSSAFMNTLKRRERTK